MMTKDEAICYLILFCASLIFIGYGMASSNITKLKTNKWECTATSIVKGEAVCIEYKTKGATK